MLRDIVKKTNLVPELVAHPSSVIARDAELLEAEEELKVVIVEVVVVVVDLLGMPGGQQIILIVSPSAQMYQPGQRARVPTA